VFALHDIRPVAPVHLLLIPKEHIADLYEVRDEHAAVLGRLMTLAGRLAKE
jgi:histidine triad (HIT) family protein